MCFAYCRYVGEYVAILYLLIWRDIRRIVIVFIIMIFSFGGALYFSSAARYSDNNTESYSDNTTENNNDTYDIGSGTNNTGDNNDTR